MQCREAVLLLGGSGQRVKGLTGGRNKHLLPVYDRTLVANAYSWLQEMDFRRVVVVCSASDVGPIHAEAKRLRSGLSDIVYVIQDEPSGTADAVRLGARECRSDEIFCTFGDNVFAKPFAAPALRPLPASVNLRVFGVSKAHGVSHVALLIPESNQQWTVRRSPHGLRSGIALTGAFVLRGSALVSTGVRPSPNDEDDILLFVERETLSQSAECELLNMRWADAASSAESLWLASCLVRDAVLGTNKEER